MRGTGEIDKAKMADFILANPFFFKDGHLEIEERNPNSTMIKEAQQFLRGRLVYKPDPNSDRETRVFPIGALLNPFEGEFNLSDCGDTWKYLSIHAGYKKQLVAYFEI